MNVCVRIRTPNETPASRQIQADPYGLLDQLPIIADRDDSRQIIVSGSNPQKLIFKQVFSSTDDTSLVYDATCAGIVQRVLTEGISGCVFAYGQTGSGKTYTTTGTSSIPGILPRAVQDLLNGITGDSDVGAACVYLSYVELHNENLRDLLRPASSAKDVKDSKDSKDKDTDVLHLMEEPNGRPYLPNVTKLPVGSIEDALAAITTGESRRAKGSNSVHEHASRSHAIFTLTVEARLKSTGEIRMGQLNIVDLAGSETGVNTSHHATHTTAEAGEVDYDEIIARRKAQGDIANSGVYDREKSKANVRNREGCHIRKSLLALVLVVNKLAEQSDKKSANPNAFIPFRDSKLTRLLRPALEHNSNTVVICTVNPAELKESLATLRFALTAQRVRQTGTVSAASCIEDGTSNGAMLKNFERQIALMQMEFAKNLEDERKRAEELETATTGSAAELERMRQDKLALEEKLAQLSKQMLVAPGRSPTSSNGSRGVLDRSQSTTSDEYNAAERANALTQEMDELKATLATVTAERDAAKNEVAAANQREVALKAELQAFIATVSQLQKDCESLVLIPRDVWSHGQKAAEKEFTERRNAAAKKKKKASKGLKGLSCGAQPEPRTDEDALEQWFAQAKVSPFPQLPTTTTRA